VCSTAAGGGPHALALRVVPTTLETVPDDCAYTTAGYGGAQRG